MTFQPVVPISGYAGWRFLERTMESQQEAFKQSTQVSRATDYFRENIAKVRTTDDLLEDRQLREVALGAFGLDDDINNIAFIRKVLDDGTTDSEALANRLSDKRYLEFSEVFGFGDSAIPNTVLPAFADNIISRFETKSFETAVGNVNDDMRLALNLKGSLGETIDGNTTVDAQWFSVMGNPPLRRVFETALGLPNSIGAIDIDQQLEAFKESARSRFGTDQLADLNNEESQDEIIRLFMLRTEVQAASGLSGGSVALTLLSQIA